MKTRLSRFHEDLDMFMDIVNELKEKTVIVEGKKDVSALKGLGIDNIVPINGRPLISIVESIVEGNSKNGVKEIVILTDFDKTGRKLYSRLQHLLKKHKIHVNSRLREDLMKFGKNKIEDFKNIRGDNYGEISANINKIHNKSPDKSKGRYRETGRYWSDFWSD